MNIFKIFQKFPNIECLEFDRNGLNRAIKSRGEIIWTNSHNDEIALYFFDKPPNIPVSRNGISDLHNGYKKLINDPRVEIISFKVIKVSGIPSILMLLRCFEAGKVEKYVGSLTIPFKNFSYVIKVNSSDNGPTGMRSAVLFAKLKKRNSRKKSNVDESDEGVDYDSEEYDDILPGHSLSRGRGILNGIIKSLIVDARLLNCERFNLMDNASNESLHRTAK